ncbi:MAG: methyltransferase domain-containing protein [Arenicella sp.]|nr:methyltransferase domain-containing protein [Arenicella sp.]
MDIIPERANYDLQADNFDHRTGLLAVTCERVVAGVEALNGSDAAAHVFEVGCGTGQLGMALANTFEQYTGMDISPEMLKQFKLAYRQQTTATPSSSVPSSLAMLQADGNKVWPVADNSANIIFSSRAIHWLGVEHIVAEVWRVAAAGESILIVGRVERAADGWESLLRQHCHTLVRQNGLKPRNGERHLKRLLQYYNQAPQGPQTDERFGAQVLAPKIADRWYQKRTLQQSLDDWAGKSGLAGTEPSAKIKSNILAELKTWALEKYAGDLPTETERHYVLYGIKIFS